MYSQQPQEAAYYTPGIFDEHPHPHPWLADPLSPDAGQAYHGSQLNIEKPVTYSPAHIQSVSSTAWTSPRSSQYALNSTHEGAESSMSDLVSSTANPSTAVSAHTGSEHSVTDRSSSQRLVIGSVPKQGLRIRPLRSDKRLSSHFPLTPSGPGAFADAESASLAPSSSLAAARQRTNTPGTDACNSASNSLTPREDQLSPPVDAVSSIFPSSKIGAPAGKLPDLTSSYRPDSRASAAADREAAKPSTAGKENPLTKLVDDFELLSFLKTHRAENPQIVLPFPLARSAQSVSVTGSSNITAENDDPESLSHPAEWKNASNNRTQRIRNESWICSKCRTELGRLSLRDPMSQRPIPFRHTFLCPDCCPPEEEEDAAEEADVAGPSSPLTVSYESGFSGLLDKAFNIPIPTRTTPRVQAIGKRRRLTGSLSTCDVCMHFIATSSAQDEDSLRPPSAPLVERICKHCHAKYRRCTDCGGRPDKRLGVGRWRLKELFPDGTRRCTIPHRPLRSLTETTCDIWRISELPSDEIPVYLTEIQKVMSLAMFATMAIPDTMECENPMCIDFRSAAVLASEAFRLLTPMITNDVEQQLGLRRYITLRWHNPLLPRGETLAEPQSQDPDVIALQKPPSLMREGYTLFSFNVMELELETGSIAVALSAPRGMGHSYHAQSHIIQCAIRRAQDDLAHTNRERAAAGLNSYPEINELWLINGHNKASRVLYRDERQRGMIPLDEYLAKYAGVTDPKHFPPHRSILLPWEFLKRYRFYARRFSGKDDLTQIHGRRKATEAGKTRRGRRPIAADNGSNVTMPSGDDADDEET